MKIQQLSIFLENRPGKLQMPCRVLAQAGINILTLALADTQQFGILRMIVRDWQSAKSVLEAAGCVVRVTEVLAIQVEDRPGGLAKILDACENKKLNIEYMYAFTLHLGDKSVLVFRFDDPDLAIKTLREAGVNVVAGVDLFDVQ